MFEKIYYLLFFCVILYQGILATLPGNDTNSALDFLVRKRRVINHLPHGRNIPRIQEVNYIVKITQDGRSICAGAILSVHNVLTAASCVRHHESMYQVLSGGTSKFNEHNVISKVTNFGSPPYQTIDGVAVIRVNPPFIFGSRTGDILLHTGILSPRELVNVYGWGYYYPIQPGTEIRQRLRSISLPIMNHEECQSIYAVRMNITDKHFCTYCPQQYCARNDEGAPVVFNHQLVGIHVWKGEYAHQRNPDVYVNLQRTDYSLWIREHTVIF